MTTRRAPFRTQWVKREQGEPKPEPESDRMKRARQLPLPGPGIVITVRLELLPEYLQLHNLKPMTSGEVRDVAQALHSRRLPGVLYVKRIRQEGQ
jgi:hypothetical protein